MYKRASKLKQVSYFADAKSWMQVDVIEKVVKKLNYIMKLENRNVLLFLDNLAVHPENLVGKCSNIKIVFLPRNTNLRLQPLDVGIIKNFKVKYQQKYVIARISNDLSASDIAKEVDILQVITWPLGKRFQKRLLRIVLQSVALCNKLLKTTNLSWMTSLLNSSNSLQI